MAKKVSDLNEKEIEKMLAMLGSGPMGQGTRGARSTLSKKVVSLIGDLISKAFDEGFDEGTEQGEADGFERGLERAGKNIARNRGYGGRRR